MAVSAQTEIPSQLDRSAVNRGGYGRSRLRDRPGIGQGRGRGHSDRPRRSEEAVGNGEDQPRSVRRSGKLRASRSRQPRVHRRFLAADAFPTVTGSPDQQCRSDGAAAPASHSGWLQMQFGTNYLGHFALTARLMPLLRRASAPRVVNVSSLAHRTASIDFNDLQGVRSYSPWKAYGQSKLAMLMFSLELQRRSDTVGWNLTSNAAHPGFARTGLFASGPGGLLSLATDFAAPFFGQSATDGARPILFAATSPKARPGAYYGPGGIGELRGTPAPALIMPRARTSATAARLWDVSEKLAETSFN